MGSVGDEGGGRMGRGRRRVSQHERQCGRVVCFNHCSFVRSFSCCKKKKKEEEKREGGKKLTRPSDPEEHRDTDVVDEHKIWVFGEKRIPHLEQLRQRELTTEQQSNPPSDPLVSRREEIGVGKGGGGGRERRGGRGEILTSETPAGVRPAPSNGPRAQDPPASATAHEYTDSSPRSAASLSAVFPVPLAPRPTHTTPSPPS